MLLAYHIAGAFGEIFDRSAHVITDCLQERRTIIGGIEFVITITGDAHDMEIPEINNIRSGR